MRSDAFPAGLSVHRFESCRPANENLLLPRLAELLTLKVSDVNPLAGTLQLRDSKNGEPRKVSLTQDAKNLLAACVTGKGGEDAVFTRGKGKAVSDFRVTWDKLTLAAGVSGLSFTISGGAPSAIW
jgi:integrase